MRILRQPEFGAKIAPQCLRRRGSRREPGAAERVIGCAMSRRRPTRERFSEISGTRPGSDPLKEGRRRGFTLLELMVVVVLIGILAAMIVPEMKGTYEDALLRSTCRELVSAFSMASSRAVSLNQLHRVHLDRGSGRYEIERKISLRERGNAFVPVRDVAGCEGELDRRITIQFRRPGEAEPLPEGVAAPAAEDATEEARGSGHDEAINFYPDGTADEGDVVLQDRDGFRLALRINPITARVRVIELHRQ